MIKTYQMSDQQILDYVDAEGRECLLKYGYINPDGSFDFDRIRAMNAPLTSDEIDERLEELTCDEIAAKGYTHPDGSIDWDAYYTHELAHNVDLNEELGNLSEQA